MMLGKGSSDYKYHFERDSKASRNCRRQDKTGNESGKPNETCIHNRIGWNTKNRLCGIWKGRYHLLPEWWGLKCLKLLTLIPWESQNIPLEPQPEFKNIRFWHFYKKKELMIWNVTKVTNGRKHKRLWLNWQSTGLLIQVVRVRVPLDAVMPLGVAAAPQTLTLAALVRIQ